MWRPKGVESFVSNKLCKIVSGEKDFFFLWMKIQEVIWLFGSLLVSYENPMITLS